MTNEEIIEKLCYVNVKLNEILNAIRKNKDIEYDIENIEYHIEDLEQILFLIVQNIKGAYDNDRKNVYNKNKYDNLFLDLYIFFQRKSIMIGLSTYNSLYITDSHSPILKEGIKSIDCRANDNLIIINYAHPKDMPSKKIEINMEEHPDILRLIVKNFTYLYCKHFES